MDNLSDVKSKWHPEEGLFTRKDPQYIANYLIRNSKDKGLAMKRLVFYMNRAGENLENKVVLNKVKDLLKECCCDAAPIPNAANPMNTTGMGGVAPGVVDGIPLVSKKHKMMSLKNYLLKKKNVVQGKINKRRT